MNEFSTNMSDFNKVCLKWKDMIASAPFSPFFWKNEKRLRK